MQCRHFSRYFLYSSYISFIVFRIRRSPYTSAVKPRHGEITPIPNNMEHYTFFAINDVMFIDSCQFMLSCLDKLSSNLSKDQFRETRKYLE